MKPPQCGAPSAADERLAYQPPRQLSGIFSLGSKHHRRAAGVSKRVAANERGEEDYRSLQTQAAPRLDLGAGRRPLLREIKDWRGYCVLHVHVALPHRIVRVRYLYRYV
jgi:hypothetical protein